MSRTVSPSRPCRRRWVTAAQPIFGALLACGTEQIELRPAASINAAGPELASPSSSQPSAEALGGAGGSVASATPAPGRDGVLDPSRQLLPTAEPSLEPEKGCQKIDFLFVIDDSSSMDDEQANLVQSFPGFIQVMQQVLEARDFHIMVVSTGGDAEQEEEPTLDPAECDEIRGAGKRRTPDGEDCGIVDGLPYMAENQPELETTFSCAAQVGTDGSARERPIEALLAATGQSLNSPGRCNAGFLREDAILVVTLITDEDDDRSDGEPEDWRQQLLTAKGDNEDALVVLGLVGDNNVSGGLLGGPCRALDADGSPRLQQFVDSLGGRLGSVCAPDYTPFFQTAVGWIDSACEDFVPPVIF